MREQLSNILKGPTFWAWIAFVATATFWTLLSPLGEGFDESWHLAYIQHVSQAKRPPLGASVLISKEIDFFLHAHPIAWSLHNAVPFLLSHDEYWRRTPDERRIIDGGVTDLRFSGEYSEAKSDIPEQYERHQPPLYYLICAPVFAAASRLFSFVNAYLILRLYSVLIASLCIPAAFRLSRAVLKQNDLASSACALLVLFPGIYPDVARVSNDALVVPLTAWALFFLIMVLQEERRIYFCGLAFTLVAGLWTKAFFIPILFGATLALCVRCRFRIAGGLLLVSLMGCPWYLYNLLQFGSITGLPETVAAAPSLASSVHALAALDWRNLLNVLATSHIWIANGSLLGVRSWIYTFIIWFFVLAVLGLAGRQRWRPMLPLIIPYGVFFAGLVYYATQIFQHTGASVIEGWYLACFAVVEAILFVAGAESWLYGGWRWIVSTMQLFLLALFVYSSLFVALPYYVGFIRHRPEGHLMVYVPSLADVPIAFSRMLRFYPWIPAALPFLLLGVTCAFGFLAIFRTIRPGKS